jgi:hypothetical protein
MRRKQPEMKEILDVIQKQEDIKGISVKMNRRMRRSALAKKRKIKTQKTSRKNNRSKK